MNNWPANWLEIDESTLARLALEGQPAAPGTEDAGAEASDEEPRKENRPG